MEPWAKRIQSLLVDGKTRAGLIQAAGVKASSVSGWFGAGAKPTKMIQGDNLVAAARYLGTTPDWIMTGKHPEQAGSQPARLSGETLRLGIALVRGVLKANNVSKFDVLEDADEVAQAMQFVVAHRLTSVTADNVLDFMQARSEKMNERTGGDGQADGYVGAQGAPATRKQGRTSTG